MVVRAALALCLLLAPESYEEQAPLDVDTVLTDTSKAYLEARARLVAHPDDAAGALLDRLTAVPPPGPAARKRLLDILAELKRPEHVELFAKELRNAVMQAPNAELKLAGAERWRPLLLDQGAASAPALAKLVGDKELPLAIRSLLIDDLVAVTETSGLGELVVLVGRGDVSLRGQLRRAMARRTKTEAAARTTVVKAADAAIDKATATPPDKAEQGRLPQLLQFRASVSGGQDAAFTDRLRALATDRGQPFTTRVASIRGLGDMEEPAARESLRGVANAELGQTPRSQSAEILGWLALNALPDEDAGKIAGALNLHEDDAPRLAAVGYALGPLPAGHVWLARSQRNPWPTVRQSALGRVAGPCDDKTVQHLAKISGPTDKGGETDRVVARAGVQALGRCGGKLANKQLTALLQNSRADVEQRAEAARQLARHGGPSGLDAVAKALSGESSGTLARRLATAIGYAPQPTPAAAEALCTTAAAGGEVSRAAFKSLVALYPEGHPCGE